MSGRARFVIRLYPAAWRKRYGDEFEALLEDRPPTLSSLFDLIKGATKMHFSVPTFPKLALLLSVTGLLTGLGISYLVTPRYISEATMTLMQTPGSAPADLRPILAEMQLEILSRTSLFSVITDQRLDLYRNERAREPIEDVIAIMRRDLEIGPTGPGSAFHIRFAYSDRSKAHDTVQTLVSKFVEANLQRERNASNMMQYWSRDHPGGIEARLAAIEKRLGIPPSEPAPNSFDPFSPNRTNMAVIDPASLPIDPIWPVHSRFMYLGFGSGVLAALIITAFRRRIQPAISFPTVSA
jgi:hypothetical protein